MANPYSISINKPGGVLYLFNPNSFNPNPSVGAWIQQISHDGSTPLNLDTFSTARRDGGKVVSAYFRPKTIVITGIIVGTSVGDCNTRIDTFKANCVGSGLNLFINDGTTQKTYIVNTQGEIAIPRPREEMTIASFTITYVVVDPPYALDTNGSTNAYLDTNIVSDLYSGSTTFGGSAIPATVLTITFTQAADITALDIVDQTNNRVMTVTQAFQNGDVLIIDTFNYTVKLNAVDVNFTGQFPNFGIGAQNFALTAYTISGANLDQSQPTGNGQLVFFNFKNEIAQKFTPTATAPISRITFALSLVGSPTNNVGVTILGDNAGSPDGSTVLGFANVGAGSIGTVFAYYNAVFSTPPLVTSGTPYWMVIRVTTNTGSDVNNYFQIRTLNPSTVYTAPLKISNDSGVSWPTTLANTALLFKEYRTLSGPTNGVINTNAVNNNFSTTTYKDVGNTTAFWNTVGNILTMNGVATAQNTTTTGTGTSIGMSAGDFQYTGMIAYTPVNTCTLTSIVLSCKKSGTSDDTQAVNLTVYDSSSLTNSSTSLSGANIGGNNDSFTLASFGTSFATKTFNFTTTTLTGGHKYFFGLSSPGAFSTTFSFDTSFTTSGTTDITYATTGAFYSQTHGIIAAYSGGTANATINTTYKNYDTSEQGQTLNLISTNADVLAATFNDIQSVAASGGSITNYLSSDGTNFEAATIGTQQIFTSVGNQLKFQTVLIGKTITPSTVSTYNPSYIKGIELKSTTAKAAQSFVPSLTQNIARIDLLATYIGVPGTITLRIETDSSGSPSGTLVNVNATATLAYSALNTNFSWATFNLASSISLTSGVTYWLVVAAAATVNAANKYLFQANNNGYSSGVMMKYNGTTWSGFASAEDLLFRSFGASGSAFVLKLSIDYTKRYL